MSTKILCPGSGERSDRVHSSGAIMCPSCNGAYLSAGMTVPDHECEAESLWAGDGEVPQIETDLNDERR